MALTLSSARQATAHRDPSAATPPISTAPASTASASPPAVRGPNHFADLLVVTAVLAAMPYLVLKTMWLAGSRVGHVSADAAAEAGELRHVIGNAVTIALVLLSFALALAWRSSAVRKLPAAVVLVPAFIGTGLLAPIVTGVPLGFVVEAVVTGASPLASAEGLHPVVYAVVYGGFVMVGAAHALLFAGSARRRWAPVLERVRAPRGFFVAEASVALVLAGLVMGAWAIAGPGVFGQGASGPPGFESITQRFLLGATAVLLAGGGLTPLLGVLGRRAPRARFALVAVQWVGIATGAVAGLTHLALSASGTASPVLIAVALAGTTAAVTLAAAWARQLSEAVE
ncbi:hypothetical protein GCM10022261_08530 [Brevibacterium daeguense]|uniref:Uncharacterized protein n=1 Tax=Brevibacterium daeguense TaxID=909936 RepID=A0ABP8EH84_9MICO|nr:hypothetical protein [Brevibacterium daeguense]